MYESTYFWKCFNTRYVLEVKKKWGAHPFYFSAAKSSRIILHFISPFQAEISCLFPHSRPTLHKHWCEMVQLTNMKTNWGRGECVNSEVEKQPVSEVMICKCISMACGTIAFKGCLQSFLHLVSAVLQYLSICYKFLTKNCLPPQQDNYLSKVAAEGRLKWVNQECLCFFSCF